jgi:6-carboxyhexanoate--CoA ligase
MKPTDLYSIRMRASIEGKHASGAERIVSSDAIDTTVNELVARARNKGNLLDEVTVHIERLGNITPQLLTALDVITLDVADPYASKSAAERLLRSIGVSNRAIDDAMKSISGGAAPSGANMRGAMIIDAATGARLEPDQERGVRASRFDWTDEAHVSVGLMLTEKGLTHFRTREALALATKVVHAPGAMAELCWSDDPDYTTGYVASLTSGYVRLPMLKRAGDGRGGRAIFVDGSTLDREAMLQYLRDEVVLISGVGRCNGMVEVDTYFDRIGGRT